MAKALHTSEPTELQYSRQAEVERLIAIGRVMLAAFSLLAIWLDPSAPARYIESTYAFLAGYTGYALLMALLVWHSYRLLICLRLMTHVFDLMVFCLFMYFTEGSASPFFVYFVFSLFCATLRWQRRVTLWTAAAAMAAYIGISMYAAEILHDPDFELNRFIIRSVYLIVVTALLGYLETYAERLRGELSKLAAWPRATSRETPTLAREMLTQAATVLDAPRALLTWNVARQARASTIRVDLGVQGEQVRLGVVDNGRGFPFHGHYDLPTLMKMNMGPRTLRERTASLGGSLVIDSSASGAHLEITVPLTQLGV